MFFYLCMGVAWVSRARWAYTRWPWFSSVRRWGAAWSAATGYSPRSPSGRANGPRSRQIEDLIHQQQAMLQGDQLYMAVFFWYLVKGGLSSKTIFDTLKNIGAINTTNGRKKKSQLTNNKQKKKNNHEKYDQKNLNMKRPDEINTINVTGKNAWKSVKNLFKMKKS